MFSKPLARKPYTDHPEDNFLEVVLHTNFKGEYCTHVLNNQTNGFAHGHYFGKNQQGLQNAMKDFNKRGVETKLNGLTEDEGDVLEFSLRRDRLIEEIKIIEAKIDSLRPANYPKDLLYSAEKTK